MKVEIAGAGLSGLTAAAAFAKAGWSVRVHEKGNALREIGAGIYMWENGLRALEEIDAYDRVVSRAEWVERPFLRDHNGETLQEDWLRNERLVTVACRHIHRSVVEVCEEKGVEFDLDSTIVSADPSGELVNSHGDKFRADLVVGADGVFSKVRESLGLKQKLVALGDGGGRHLIERNADDPVNETIEQWNGGRRIGIIPCSPDETYIFLCCPAKDRDGRQQHPFEAQTWIESFPEFRSQIERIPFDTEGRWAPFFDVQVTKWSEGNTVLLGDAAHEMSPNLGQAACVAMASAVNLVAHISNSNNKRVAIQSWEHSMRPIAEKIQRNSRIYGQIGTHWPNKFLDLRSSIVRKVTQSRKVQGAINFAAENYPNQTIKTV